MSSVHKQQAVFSLEATTDTKASQMGNNVALQFPI